MNGFVWFKMWEKHRLWAFETKVLREMYESKRNEVEHLGYCRIKINGKVVTSCWRL
jgi:hypothetical protein